MTAFSLWMLALVVLMSSALTWLTIQLAVKLALLDPIEERRLHVAETPRGGGLGIALIVICALLAFPLSLSTGWLSAFGLLVIALVGGWDDIRSLPAGVKLVGQVLGVGLLALSFADVSLAWRLCALIIVILTLVNVWNFMDGSNGMASVQAMLVSSVLFWLADEPVMAILAAACAGFLPFNLFRARVFLGDIGSHVLGAAVALGACAAWANGKATVAMLVVLLSAFLLDAGWTLSRRMLRGEPFWLAHSQHLYQQAIRHGYSHGGVCAAYAAWTVLVAAIALAMRQWSPSGQAMAALLVLLLGSLVFFLLPRWWRQAAVRAGSPMQ